MAKPNVGVGTSGCLCCSKPVITYTFYAAFSHTPSAKVVGSTLVLTVGDTDFASKPIPGSVEIASEKQVTSKKYKVTLVESVENLNQYF